MNRNWMIYTVTASLVIFLAGFTQAGDLTRILKRVETLKIQRQGYVLGSRLSKAQMKIAGLNPENSKAPDTFKFRDKNLHVVAQKDSNRIIVLYERFEKAGSQKVKDVVGDLTLNFDDPTVMAHDKIVYWAWAGNGKITTQQFDQAKKEKKTLDILVTVKCISEVPIMEKDADPKTGELYYIISSDPVLKFFLSRQKS